MWSPSVKQVCTNRHRTASQAGGNGRTRRAQHEPAPTLADMTPDPSQAR